MLRSLLISRAKKLNHVLDIGCGQAIGDLFLSRDFDCSFTLLDIEDTPDQYHLWSNAGSGYANLKYATELLIANGVDQTKVKSLNPRTQDVGLLSLEADLVTSYYSCGFHYPVDEYLDLFLKVIKNGGMVCLDIRDNYQNRNEVGLSALYSTSEQVVLYEDDKSKRVFFS